MAKLNIWSIDQMNRVYSINGIAPTIDTCSGGSREPKILTKEGGIFNLNSSLVRKITERESMRLQGYSDKEITPLILAVDESGRRLYPKTLIYQFAGNSVCVDCFVHITNQILNDMNRPKKSIEDWFNGGEI